jgi:hypothetical protein
VADDNILSWNAANWITVSLMALILFSVFGLVQKKMQAKVAAPAASS